MRKSVYLLCPIVHSDWYCFSYASFSLAICHGCFFFFYCTV